MKLRNIKLYSLICECQFLRFEPNYAPRLNRQFGNPCHTNIWRLYYPLIIGHPMPITFNNLLENRTSKPISTTLELFHLLFEDKLVLLSRRYQVLSTHLLNRLRRNITILGYEPTLQVGLHTFIKVILFDIWLHLRLTLSWSQL